MGSEEVFEEAGLNDSGSDAETVVTDVGEIFDD